MFADVYPINIQLWVCSSWDGKWLSSILYTCSPGVEHTVKVPLMLW